ncbi:MAG: hydrogenase maturation protease [Gemmataceae bacterium]
MRLLVIGYGNELRGDDGVGPRVARAVHAWRMPGVVARATHGLAPELAEELARAESVVFVDARAGAEGGLEVVELVPGPPAGLGHASEPRWLLGLAESLWGHRPRAWLLTVPAERLGVGEGLSEMGARGLADALTEIRGMAQRA